MLVDIVVFESLAGAIVYRADRLGSCGRFASTKGRHMNIDKSQILDLLRSQGDTQKVQQADQQLPDQVDTDRDGGLLSSLGIDIGDVIAKLGGGGGGLGKLLG